MSSAIYKINQKINTPIEFRGLKAQYIWYLGIALVGLMLVFAVMYIIGISPFICVGLILVSGVVVFMQVHKLSNRYGEHGMMKKVAKRGIPSIIKSYSRTQFIK